jgi:hypothetical protein
MSVSILSCPNCNTLLLDDTIQCPSCRHVLDPERVAQLPQPTESEPDGPSPEDECESCHEMVRHGLVRCWKCGAFMRKEIADVYQQMQAAEAPVIYSDSEEPADAKVAVEDTEENSPGNDPAGDGAEADDFAPSDEEPTRDELQREPEPEPLADKGETEVELAPIPEEDDDFETDPQFAPQTLEDNEGISGPYDVAGQPSEATQTESPAASPAQPAVDGAATVDSEQSSGEPTDASTAAEQVASDEPGDSAPPEESTESHSVATGGEVLLNVALEEEAEMTQRRRNTKTTIMPKSPDGLLVFCPHGHRVEVREKHRGKTGRCPRCKSLFFVPEQPWQEGQEQADEAAQATADKDQDEAAAATGAAAGESGTIDLTHWVKNVHIHEVNPTKLKLKPGSMTKAFDFFDVGFGADGMLLAKLTKSPGLRGSAGKKLEAARQAMLDHFSEGKPLDGLPVVERRLFDAAAARETRVVQPIVYEFESMFAGVPVFGEGRIAVVLPKAKPDANPQCASFALTEFREFSQVLHDVFQIPEFGAESEIPLTDTFTELKCHFSDEPLLVLDRVQFYQADPACKVRLIGRRCQGCELVISEESRKKEKIGGVSGRGIAKSLCPKCKKKFGDISLYTLEAGSKAKK